MAGFESIVRPVVLPNIRPTPQRAVRPQETASDDPEKGMCVIRGASGKIVQLPYSYSSSMSKSRPTETQRQVDEVRVYQQDDDGTVNKKNFVDVEVANKIWKRGGRGPAVMSELEKEQRARDARAYDAWMEYYKRVEEAKNIEIRKRDQIRKNEDAQ